MPIVLCKPSVFYRTLGRFQVPTVLAVGFGQAVESHGLAADTREPKIAKVSLGDDLPDSAMLVPSAASGAGGDQVSSFPAPPKFPSLPPSTHEVTSIKILKT